MGEINFDELAKDVSKLLQPIRPLRWYPSITVPRQRHRVLRKLVKSRGNPISLHRQDGNYISLIDDEEKSQS